jgi:hypothetical protein
LAKGYYYYACLKDYDAAARYFERARPFLSNNSQIPESLAYVAPSGTGASRTSTTPNGCPLHGGTIIVLAPCQLRSIAPTDFVLREGQRPRATTRFSRSVLSSPKILSQKSAILRNAATIGIRETPYIRNNAQPGEKVRKTLL